MMTVRVWTSVCILVEKFIFLSESTRATMLLLYSIAVLQSKSAQHRNVTTSPFATPAWSTTSQSTYFDSIHGGSSRILGAFATPKNCCPPSTFRPSVTLSGCCRRCVVRRFSTSSQSTAHFSSPSNCRFRAYSATARSSSELYFLRVTP